jgi:hypothetical protein
MILHRNRRKSKIQRNFLIPEEILRNFHVEFMCFEPKLSKIPISRTEMNNYDKNSNLQTGKAATPAFQEAKDGLHVVVCVEPQPA